MLNVPYWAFGVYAISVIGASLMVGLMPPFINPPDCDESGLPLQRDVQDEILNRAPRDIPQNLNVNLELNNAVKTLIDEKEAVLRTEQSAPKRGLNINSREDKVNYFRENVEPMLRDDPHYERYLGRLKSKAITDRCPEILAPTPGVTYPWNSPRLPANIKPINYDLELVLTNVTRNVYIGEITATFEVTEPTNYVLLHSAENDLPSLVSILDRNGNNVAVFCFDEYIAPRTDYLVIRTEQNLQPANGPYKILFLFIDFSVKSEAGIFSLKFNFQQSAMIASKFQPIDARRAYPVFDEPGLKATYNVRIIHNVNTVVLSNTPIKSSNSSIGIPNEALTYFEQTPPMPPALMAYLVFNFNEFYKISTVVNSSNGPVTINVWGRITSVELGYAKDALDMSAKLFTALLDIFRDVNPSAIPHKLDIFAIPDYPVDAISHFGLPIIREDKILFKHSTASERDKQNLAFLLSKILAQNWFGNFVTMKWWDELWLQEGFSDYIKYRAIEEPYGAWNILGEFITEELIPVMISDGYPSSHPIYKPISNPYEIEEYFDEIESSKTAALIRWIEYQSNVFTVYQAINAFLNANPWGVGDINLFYQSINTVGRKRWPAKDFFDRWILQSNVPAVFVELLDGPPQQIRLTQSRGLNSIESIFFETDPYPSPYNYTWYIPIECEFGTGPLSTDSIRIVEFDLDTPTGTFNLPNASDGKPWQWVNCDKEFSGLYESYYLRSNWIALEKALESNNNNFEPEDRANIIHNLFLNAYSGRGDYFQLAAVLHYLRIEKDYLPWRAAYLHLMQIMPVLEFRQVFHYLAEWFSFRIRFLENSIDLWTPGQYHLENLLKETVINLACYLQDPVCLKKASELWPAVLNSLYTGDFENSTVPAYAREVVYNYHLQNTYDVDDWGLILFDYDGLLDEAEHRKLLQALTFTRLPYLLSRIELDELYIDKVDYFTKLNLLSKNPVGRDIAWGYFQADFFELLGEYSVDDPRLGQALLDITKTFENGFLFLELLEFVFALADGAIRNARIKALEICSTNVVWLYEKELELFQAFPINGRKVNDAYSSNINPLLDQTESQKIVFIRNARESLKKKMQEHQINSLFY